MPTRLESKAVKPKQDVHITFTISETAEGKLNIAAEVPDHAAGTVALLLTEQLLQYAKDAMDTILDTDAPIQHSSSL